MRTTEIRGTYSLGSGHFHSGDQRHPLTLINLLNITVQFLVKIIITCHLNRLYFEFRTSSLGYQDNF